MNLFERGSLLTNAKSMGLPSPSNTHSISNLSSYITDSVTCKQTSPLLDKSGSVGLFCCFPVEAESCIMIYSFPAPAFFFYLLPPPFFCQSRLKKKSRELNVKTNSGAIGLRLPM